MPSPARSSLLLAALLLLALAPNASAAITLGYTGTTITISGTGDNVTYVGFDTTANDVTVRNSTGVVNNTGGVCAEEVLPTLGSYFHCPAAAATVTATYGAGADRFTLEGVCIPVVTVALGEGPGEFGNSYTDGCPGDQTATVAGGSAADILQGGPGVDTFDGGGGPDELRGAGGDDVLRSGPGNDTLTGDAGNDQLAGEDGDDRIRAGAGNDSEDGGAGNDVVGGGDDDQGSDDVHGGPGADRLELDDHSGAVTATLDDAGGDGSPGEGDNYHSDFEDLLGTAGDDVIVGTPNPDRLDGHFGNDVIRGGAGNDELTGSSGNDQLLGEDGGDTLYGGENDDTVDGGPGADSLFGDYASCSAYGCSAGNDRLLARDGVADSVNCGSGADSAQVDALDVIGTDGFQVCESVDRAAAPAGPPPPGPGTGGAAAPRVAAVKLSLAKATAGRRRFTVAFTLDRAATVTVTVTRKGARKALGSVSFRGRAGRNTRIVKKVRGRALARGTYKLSVKVGRTARTLTVRVR
jgi:Ca2+-binding RTX toxin-like protein